MKKLEQLLPAEIGLLYCNKLFYLERTLKELEAEERKQQRTILEQPVWGTVLELAWHTASNWRKQAWESGELCPKIIMIP